MRVAIPRVARHVEIYGSGGLRSLRVCGATAPGKLATASKRGMGGGPNKRSSTRDCRALQNVSPGNHPGRLGCLGWFLVGRFLGDARSSLIESLNLRLFFLRLLLFSTASILVSHTHSLPHLA